MFERFDPDSKLAVFHALHIANHRQRDAISPEDLLIGLTWKNHDHDCQFGSLKSDADRLWAGVGVTHIPLSATPYSTSRLPLNKQSKNVLLYMREAADADDQSWMDIDHMLLGILRQGGLAARALRDAGWDEERIRSAPAYGRARYPQRPVPSLARWRVRFQRYGRWTTLRLFALGLAAALLYLTSQN
jgi:hypothetical protein